MEQDQSMYKNPKKIKTIQTGNQISEDLIYDILSYLPVKVLLQFKTVCISWYDIISSSAFISKHLRNYYDNDNNWRDRLILQRYKCRSEGYELVAYKLLIDDDDRNRVLSHRKMDSPGYAGMRGPCDGIYYLWTFANHPPKRCLWNPALNEVMDLPDFSCLWKPNLPSGSASSIHENIGFGYDSKTDDYKVVLIMGYLDKRVERSRVTDNPMSILIYSLRMNSWRYWGDMDNSYDLLVNGSYVFVNGCYYWAGFRPLPCGTNYKIIVSFDIIADTYQEIPLPKFKSLCDYDNPLIVYGDSIAFVTVPDHTRFCIWTHNNGVWTRKLSMKVECDIYGAVNCLKDNIIVLRRERQNLVLFNTITKEVFKLDFPQPLTSVNICAYKESLVSIKYFGKNITHKGRYG